MQEETEEEEEEEALYSARWEEVTWPHLGSRPVWPTAPHGPHAPTSPLTTARRGGPPLAN